MIKISDIEYFSNDRTIRFLNQDCNEFMKGCKENEFDLNLSDPPYGINVAKMAYTQEENRPCLQKNGTILRVNKNKYKYGNWDSECPKIETFNLIKKTSKNQIIWGINYMPYRLGNGRIVWYKLNGDNSFSDAEIAYCSYHDKVRLFEFLWSGMIQGKSFENGRVQQGNKKLNQKRIHPTEKPIELYKWILDNYTKPTDTILDCFGGSMSNAIACHMMRRKLTIIELDKDYFDAAINRFSIYESKVEDIENLGFAKTELEKNYPTLF
jgi:site-specific DNA-methyltransferase (adenine-specific)